jgi:hypothetical protein
MLKSDIKRSRLNKQKLLNAPTQQNIAQNLLHIDGRSEVTPRSQLISESIIEHIIGNVISVTRITSTVTTDSNKRGQRMHNPHEPDRKKPCLPKQKLLNAPTNQKVLFWNFISGMVW